MIKVIVIIGIVILILILGFILLLTTKVCDGGDLFVTDCGKLLFPWTKRFKLPSGKYCCITCYKNELEKFVEMRKDPDGLTFKDDFDVEFETEE